MILLCKLPRCIDCLIVIDLRSTFQFKVSSMQPTSGQWAHSLYGCCSNCSVCCVGCWLPCVLFAENGKMLRGSLTQDGDYWMDCLLYSVLCLFTGCQCILGMMRRPEIRMKYALREQPCNDCCVHCCCHECALCQEHNELKLKMVSGYPVQGQVVMVQGGAYPPPAPMGGYTQPPPAQFPMTKAQMM